MSWVKLDDRFFQNPKILSAGKEAALLFIAGMCFCATHETGGVIPADKVRTIAADAGVDFSSQPAATLVRLGIWKKYDEQHFCISDYLRCEFCPSPTNQDARKTRGYRAWRETVVCRDGYQCTKCGSTDDLHAHHIKPWATNPDLRFDSSNGVTLCGPCHYEAHKKADE